MDGKSEGGDPRGLVFVPIGAEGSTDPGCRPGIYFDAERFAWAERARGLTIALDDQTFFVINAAT